SMLALTKEHQPNRDSERIVILHELSHAVHDCFVQYSNPQVKAAYQQAMERKLYDEVEDQFGRKIRGYAAANEREYFAELSCAYLDKLHYQPFTRDGLKTFDPNGYKLMEAVWGKPYVAKEDPKKAADKATPAPAGDKPSKAE